MGYFKTVRYPRTDWCPMTEPDEGINGRSLQWPRGKGLGGSNSSNGLLYVRGQAEDYDRWAELGNRDWAFDGVLPNFEKLEDEERDADEYHGTGGPLTLAVNQVTTFTQSDPSVERPDIRFHRQPLSADKPGDGAHKISAFTSSVFQLGSHSRSPMEMKSIYPPEYTATRSNYLSDERNWR